MNLTRLASFHSVAETGSFSRAAERLLVSQPAVSKQVKELETAVGMVLLDRLPKGIRLTRAGEVLHMYARRVFAARDEAQRAVADLQAMQVGRLIVGASPTIGVYFLPQLFIKFRQAHPKIRLQLEIAHSQSIGRRLMDGMIDIAFTETAVDKKQFDSVVFMTDDLVVIAPPGHPLTRKRSVTAAALSREPFVVRETGPENQSLVERAMSQRGLSIQPAMSLGSIEAIKQAVAAGVGVAMVSRLAIDLELETKRLALIRLSDLSIQRPLHRLLLHGRTQSPAATAFLAMLPHHISSVPRLR